MAHHHPMKSSVIKDLRRVQAGLNSAARHLKSDVRNKATDILDEMTLTVENQPLKYLAIAGFAGWVIGLAMRRKRRFNGYHH